MLVATMATGTPTPKTEPVCDWPTIAPWCERVRELLTPERFGHVVRVTDLAVSLGRANGFSEAELRATALAAILHDIARELPADRLFKLAEPRNSMEADNPLTVHGRAGRRMAEMWGVSDERVLAAIEGHVFGGDPANRIGVALYIADVSEPGRNVNADIRELAHTDLAAAYVRAVSAKVEYLRRVGKPVHPDTLAAYEATGSAD